MIIFPAMGWDLEKRVCCAKGCGNEFRVLPKSAQRHCSIPHNPDGPTDFREAAREALKKTLRLKREKKLRLVGRVRELYAEGLKTPEVIDKLDAEGFRKAKKGHRIDAMYLQILRYKYKIRIPQKPPAR